MSPFILEEGWFLLYSVLLGIGITFVYDCLRICRRVVAHGVFWVSLEDMVYWIFVSCCVFYLLYCENNGGARHVPFQKNAEPVLGPVRFPAVRAGAPGDPLHPEAVHAARQGCRALCREKSGAHGPKAPSDRAYFEKTVDGRRKNV